MIVPDAAEKVALVCGGSRGIGKAVVLALAGRGVGTIVVNYLQDDEAAAQTKAQVEAAGSACYLERANLGFPQEIDALFERIGQKYRRLDIFIHAAAYGAFKPLHRVKPNQWDLSMAINARSFLQCTQRCLSLMPSGKIVAISSLGSLRSIPNYGAIGASKAALEASVRQLAMELCPRGIQVNGVSAGFVRTSSLAKFPEFEKMLDQVIAVTPAGRIGTPEDVARVVMLLISPESDWIQGQVIVADGGFSLI